MASPVNINHLFQATPEGGNVGNSEEGMWVKYMETVKDYDERIANAWKEDVTGLLVFVSCILQIPELVAIMRS
jgi:hypothetical protein